MVFLEEQTTGESHNTIGDMKPFQQRVVDEKHELDIKIGKLADFLKSELFGGLPADEKGRMMRQFVLMEMYSETLDKRIAHFAE